MGKSHEIAKKVAHSWIDRNINSTSMERARKQFPNAVLGTRWVPTDKSKDSDELFRGDWGKKLDDKIKIAMQANRNAKDRNVAAAAQGGPHDVANAWWDPVADPEGEQLREDLKSSFDDIKEGLEDAKGKGKVDSANAGEGSRKRRSRSRSSSRGRKGK